MIYDEIQFFIDGGLKKSFFGVDSTDKLATLNIGDEVEIDFSDILDTSGFVPPIQYIVTDIIYNDYNITGLHLQYKLKIV